MTSPTLFDGEAVPAAASPAALDIKFFVPGKPAPQGSKNAIPIRNKAGRVVKINQVESSKALAPWRELVAFAAHNAMGGRPLALGAVTVTLNFVLPRPKSAPKTKTPPAIKRNGDIDKLARACLDACTGRIFEDDAQVISLVAYKRIAEIGETAGAEIRVEAES